MALKERCAGVSGSYSSSLVVRWNSVSGVKGGALVDIHAVIRAIDVASFENVFGLV